MKRLFYLLTLFLFMIPISVRADHIYRVDMKIDILEDGTANIKEIWDVKASSGSEWYKTMYELGNSELSNFKVLMDNEELKYASNWDINGSLNEKAGYYGINNTSRGIELCFGKSDMKRHTFTLKYTLSNYVFNTSDSQVLYWTLMPEATLDNFSVEVTSYYQFPDTLDVWGYGYKGYAYVKDGKISMSNEGSLNGDYVTLLVKFPKDTFKTSNVVSSFNDFNSVYNKADEGTFEYNYDDNETSWFDKMINFIFGLFPLILFGILSVIGIKSAIENGYGYIGNKTIDKKNVPMFRDIPCNKDIYYANALIKLNDFGYKEGNILGAILLKWVKYNKIGFKNEKSGIFNRDTSVIDLMMNPTFDNDLETKLFEMMYEASRDGLLEAKELEKWCRSHYSEFLSLFNRIQNETIDNLKSNGFIYKRTNKEECKRKNVMNDKIYNDSIQLYGLKKYLEEFSRMNTKEVMEVKLWDEYLMFAYLFGIADKVAKQLKDMYPEILEQPEMNGSVLCDYDTLLFLNHISMKSVSAASSARAAAQSYSSGGGGFSTGGGGGGSFGGGGGSMGGR